jgi:hypothetical protein
LVWSATAGIALGLLYAASPLFLVTLAGAAGLLWIAGRDLPADERRRIVWILGVAFAVRFLLIAALLVINIPYLSDLGIGGLRGDEAYYLGRAIRARDIMLGITQGRYDYFVISDEYGRTSYLQLLTFIQMLFGPTPYSMRAFNSLLFVTAAYMLFRLCRPGFGSAASALALIALLFLPSLLVSSTSTSKEPSYFFVTAVLLTSAVAVIRRPGAVSKAGAVVALAVCLWILDDLRRGALVLGVSGLTLAAALRVLLVNPRRAIAAAVVTAAAFAALWTAPPIREHFLDAVASVAKLQAGHVFTSGHAYKLLDDGFYMHPGTPAAWSLKLTELQAGRFLARAAVSFVVTPLPWEMVSVSELVFFPEHMLWLLMVVFVPVGAVAGWRRDPTITACLLGFALPTAAVLAVTTGNVGTLLRLRGLVTPNLLWFAVLGVLRIYEWMLVRSRSVAMSHAEAMS